jgi:hypothetical protein
MALAAKYSNSPRRVRPANQFDDMDHPLILLLIFVVPLALAVLGLWRSESMRRRAMPPIEDPVEEPIETEDGALIEVQALPLELAPKPSRTNVELLKHAYGFVRSSRSPGRERTADFLARKLNLNGVPAIGLDLDPGVSASEALLTALPGFCVRNTGREIVLLALDNGRRSELAREGYLAVAVDRGLRLQPVLQKILGRDWRKQALTSAIGKLKPQAA